MDTATLKVTGMSCEHCVRAVKGALEELDGVQSAEVDLQNARAMVHYDEGKTGTREMVGAVMDEGYTAEKVD